MGILTIINIVIGITIVIASLIIDMPWLAILCIASITLLATSTPSWQQIVYSVTIFVSIYAILSIIANIDSISENFLLDLAMLETKFFVCACASTAVAVNILTLMLRVQRSRFIARMFVAIRIAEELLRYIPTITRIVETNYGTSGIRKVMLIAKILMIHSVSRCIEYYEALMNHLMRE